LITNHTRGGYTGNSIGSEGALSIGNSLLHPNMNISLLTLNLRPVKDKKTQIELEEIGKTLRNARNLKREQRHNAMILILLCHRHLETSCFHRLPLEILVMIFQHASQNKIAPTFELIL